MTTKILRDKHGKKIASISEDSHGNQTIYDAMTKKMGIIRQESSGKKTAFDRLGRKLAEYDPRTDITKLKNGKNCRGNVLLDSFFSE